MVLTQRVPQQLVDIVNAVFTSIDNCADFIGSVWKAETIGDCYIALIGGPLPSKNHSYRAVVFAISILQTMERISRRLQIQLDVRVGVHSGQVTSGVIASLMPKYLMFGRDCSITAELEKQAPPNTVLVSEATMSQIGLGWEDFGGITVTVPGLSSVKASILKPSRANRDMMMRLKQYQELEIFQRFELTHPCGSIDSRALGKPFSRVKVLASLIWGHLDMPRTQNTRAHAHTDTHTPLFPSRVPPSLPSSHSCLCHHLCLTSISFSFLFASAYWTMDPPKRHPL